MTARPLASAGPSLPPTNTEIARGALIAGAKDAAIPAGLAATIAWAGVEMLEHYIPGFRAGCAVVPIDYSTLKTTAILLFGGAVGTGVAIGGAADHVQASRSGQTAAL